MPRLALDRLEIVLTALQVRARVTLRLGGSLVEGEADAGATREGLLRAVAQACVRAAGTTLGPTRRLELDQVEQVGIGARQVLVVVVTMLGPHGPRVLTGCALVGAEPSAAATAAVLAALACGSEA